MRSSKLLQIPEIYALALLRLRFNIFRFGSTQTRFELHSNLSERKRCSKTKTKVSQFFLEIVEKSRSFFVRAYGTRAFVQRVKNTFSTSVKLLGAQGV